MLFKYQATSPKGEQQSGTIDAPTQDIAIGALQRRNLIVVSIELAEKPSLWQSFALLGGVRMKEVVILSRQISTLFEASVSVLNAFKLLSAESDNPRMRKELAEITDDIQGGLSISNAMAKHAKVFSPFYVSMVKAGEESGKLSDTFNYLADYLERSYELVQKAKNALIYPIFVIVVFIAVMILMLVVVVPQLSVILKESGQELPIYTRIVVGISQFFVDYGIFLLLIAIVGVFLLWQYARTKAGKMTFDRARLAIPYIGDLYKKLYLSRISDNIDTMLGSGIPVIKSLEISADVVGSEVYREVLLDTAEQIKGGSSMSGAFTRHPEIPGIVIQMARIGEETGKLGFVLKTIARFYKREVDAAVDTLVGLIEPFMIVFLGLGVGIMLASVLVPIYNISSAI